ncbi:S9 family peptidase [Curtobacterium sp. MCLR17_040]|uniref:alpha/beta hydrolase family protein n=1 Tax=Curtobacterium sp. MCLR17_040 TaxID=2175625 RepID=UPI0015E8E19C|nr:alpha/beta fold hydrolase [Curtobacterium sp. MCLR17_040]
MSRSARPAEDVVQETARSAGFIALGAGLAAAAVGTAVIGGFVAAVARAVVTPDRKRNERVPIHAVDPVRKTVTIERTADTELQGRYSLWFGGGTGHMRVGEVLGTTDTTVTRRIIAIDAGDPTAARRGRWGGWFYLTPGELDVPVEDVDSVLRWLTAQDAQSVVLMGWSMGGAVVLQTLLRSRFAGLVDGVVLESPVVDWHAVLKSQSQLLRLPRPVRKVAQRLLRAPVLYRLAGLQQPVDLRELDMVTRSDELTVPILLLHSDDDGFVPSSASHDLARARPDLVRLEIQTTARHTKLWNHDADWFDARILAWLTEVVQRRGAASAR